MDRATVTYYTVPPEHHFSIYNKIPGKMEIETAIESDNFTLFQIGESMFIDDASYTIADRIFSAKRYEGHHTSHCSYYIYLMIKPVNECLRSITKTH